MLLNFDHATKYQSGHLKILSSNKLSLKKAKIPLPPPTSKYANNDENYLYIKKTIFLF